MRRKDGSMQLFDNELNSLIEEPNGTTLIA